MVGMLKHYNVGHNTLYSAMQTRLMSRSSEALAEEERQDRANGLTNIATLMRANQVRVSDRTDNIEDSVAVMFNDPKTNQRITLNLSKENLNKLKGQFDTKDFYAREDGVIRLNGKAEAFVGGWFGDIAYQQNFVEADSDKNGRVEGSELRDLKTAIVNFSYDDVSATDVSVDRYVKGVVHSTTSETLEDTLNAFLEMDKNFDGHIEQLAELYDGDMQQLIYDIDQAILKVERSALNKINIPDDSQAENTTNIFNDIQSTDVELKKKLEKMKKMREEMDERFAQKAKELKEELEETRNKQQEDSTDHNALAPVVEEIRTRVAYNDVQLFESRA